MQNLIKKFTLISVLLVLALRLQAQTVLTVKSSGCGVPDALDVVINNANATPGTDPVKIVFDPSLQGATINCSVPTITRSVIIDGGNRVTVTSSNGFSFAGTAVNSEIRNIAVITFLSKPGISFLSGSSGGVVNNCTITKSLYGIFINKSDNITIKGCKIGVKGAAQTINDTEYNWDGIVVCNSTNIKIGGTYASEGNIISGNRYKGIWIRGSKITWRNGDGLNANNASTGPSNGVAIQYNYIGVSKDGTVALPNQDGIFLEGSTYITVKNNTISGNSSVGLNLEENVIKADIQSNAIGTDPVGNTAIQNDYGIVIRSSEDIKVGGDFPNIIAGNKRVGIEVPASMSGIEISGNYIGTGNSYGSNALPNDTAIVIREGSSNVVVSKNLITSNNRQGVVVADNSYFNKITQNRIYENTVPGIKLVQSSATSSRGGNFLKAKPGFDSYVNKGNNNVLLRGHSEPFDVVEVFESDNKTTLKNAKTYLGTAQADQNGNWETTVFTFALESVSGGYFVATATDKSNNTSELNDPYNVKCNANVDITLFITSPDCGPCNGKVEATLSRKGNFSFQWATCNTWGKEFDNSVVVGDNSNIFNNVCAGCYTLTVTDNTNGCNAYKGFNVTEGEEHECLGCVRSFAPMEGKEYLISTWVKEVSENSSSLTAYTSPNLNISFPGVSFSKTFTATGMIIDGWQKIEGSFIVPSGAKEIDIDLVNTGNNSVYFDDIRVHPKDGNMETYVFDPITLRMSAKLDENNYATFYEYDQEGKLVRIKKETERGVMTIQESRENMTKVRP